MQLLIWVMFFIYSTQNIGVNMGSSITHAMEEQQQEHDDRTLEELQTLEKMMINKIAAESSQMKDDALQDKSLPIVAIVDTSEKYSVKVENVPPEQIHDTVDAILGGNFIEGLEKLLSIALNELVGDTSAGEKFKKDFHVVFSNNSLLRVDFMLYKYDFSSEGIVEKIQNGFCYYAQIGVLDLKKVSPQVLLYELTRAIGPENLQAAASELEKLGTLAERLYTVIDQMARAAKADSRRLTGEEDEPEGLGNPRMRIMMKSLEADDQ